MDVLIDGWTKQQLAELMDQCQMDGNRDERMDGQTNEWNDGICMEG